MQRHTLIIISLVACIHSFSQQYSFVQYTPNEGLADTRVEKIFQDSRGIMYFLTRDGYSSFDGQRFQE